MRGLRVRRAARRLGLGRNPLRRRTDRLETSLTVVVALALLTFGPLLVWRVGAAGYHDAVSAAERDRRLQRFEVSAVLQDDPTKYLSGSDVPAQQGPVPARWTAPDGTARAGAVVPPPDARSGEAVAVTVDVHGNPTSVPVPPDPVGLAISLACATGMGLAIAAAGVLALARVVLNRYRMRGWQRGWLTVERQWSGRRR